MIKRGMHRVVNSRLMQGAKRRAVNAVCNNKGMELVQVAILVAIAIIVGLLFREKIEEFVKEIFSRLSSGNFQ